MAPKKKHLSSEVTKYFYRNLRKPMGIKLHFIVLLFLKAHFSLHPLPLCVMVSRG